MILAVAINLLAAAYRGKGRAEAYLEFAQEHFLDWLRTEHLFEDETVVFKGGTAIRKFILGIYGRFSTDLDLDFVGNRNLGQKGQREVDEGENQHPAVHQPKPVLPGRARARGHTYAQDRRA